MISTNRIKYIHKIIARHGKTIFASVTFLSLKFEKLTIKNTIKKIRLARADKLFTNPSNARKRIKLLATINPIYGTFVFLLNLAKKEGNKPSFDIA